MDMDARTETERLGRDEAERNEDQGQGWPRWLIPLAVLAALVVIGGGIWYWFSTRGIVSTDDARIAGNATQVAPQVTGRVVAILFADNQHVTEGQKLVELDPRDLEARLDQALAQQASAQSQLTQARKDYERFQHLNPAAVTQQQRDQVDAAYRADTAKLAAANQAVEGARAQIGVAKAAVAAAQAGVKQAEATVEQARLQLSYATITAPVTGRVTHRTVNVGDVVQAGQPLFALVQDKLWVQADFKETALAGMKPGQKVAISVDAVPGVTFRGRVDSFQDGTGAQFSALPAENATGNWVKIVQRVPVKIVFEGDDYRKYFLAPGMSAEPTVTLR